MQIIVDIRSLHTKQPSGVEHFTMQVLERLFTLDKDNQYTLYYNAFKKKQFDQFHFINVFFKQTQIPNRILNLAFKFFGYPTIESLAGEARVLLMPNPNMIALRSTTKFVLVVHDLSPILMPEMYSLKAQLWHKFINIPKLVKRADKILAVSDFTRQTLIDKYSIEPNKIVSAQLAVDHDRFNPNLDIVKLRSVRNRYALPGEFILFLGTIEPRKNLSRLISAFEQLNRDTHLVIAGKLGWKYNDVLRQIEQSKKHNMIHYINYVNEEDKPYLLKLASVFAWPSLYEGFGLPALEAAAVGTPVLTSNVTSLPEVMGDSALLVNPYNVEEISRGLEILLTQEIVREKLIKRGLERASKFSWDKTAEILKSLLN
jgi:glycosyltransferase involved in cell wall biosynthesis